MTDAFLSTAFVLAVAYLVVTYVCTGGFLVVAAVEHARQRRRLRLEDFDVLAASRFTIPVSVLAPAYNEEAGIIGSVESMLRLDYPEFQVIVVNDGSTDGTLPLLIERFELEPEPVDLRLSLPHRPLRGAYRSRKHSRLTVLDKVNGGKADALNCALAVARYRYVCTVDCDSMYYPSALLRGMRLAMRDPARIIGVTSAVAVTRVPSGGEPRPAQHPADSRLLVLYQHLDYLRAFMNNRVAWSRLGIMLCSIGAFAIWRRDVVEDLGGFSSAFTCEDIEFTFRAHERFLREGRPFEIVCLPDTVGQTEGPDTIGALVRQRARWQRVTMETLWHYRGMFANPRYGAVGLLGMPYYVLAEGAAPVFELLSAIALVVAAATGRLDVVEFAAVVAAIAFVNGVSTSVALLYDDLSSRPNRRSALAWMLLVGPAETLLFRPFLLFARVKGCVDFFRGDKSWDKFERNRRTAAAGA